MALTGQDLEKQILDHQENLTYWFRYLIGGVLTLLGVLAAYIWRKLESRITAQVEWRAKFEEAGGVVTGDKLVAAIREVADQMAKTCRENVRNASSISAHVSRTLKRGGRTWLIRVDLCSAQST